VTTGVEWYVHLGRSLAVHYWVVAEDKASRTGETPPELNAALDPVLRDLDGVGLRPRIEPYQWSSSPGQLTAMSWWPTGDGAGIWVMANDSLEQRVAMLAEQIQDVAVGTLPSIGRPAVWPECPDHPDSHPLQARYDGTAAVWACPRTGRRITEIGHLGTAP
jgi:hypothetical protein